MTPRNIFAYTAPNPDFPPYISINETGGRIEVTVRSPKRPPGGRYQFDMPGDVACIELPREQLRELQLALIRELPFEPSSA